MGIGDWGLGIGPNPQLQLFTFFNDNILYLNLKSYLIMQLHSIIYSSSIEFTIITSLFLILFSSRDFVFFILFP